MMLTELQKGSAIKRQQEVISQEKGVLAAKTKPLSRFKWFKSHLGDTGIFVQNISY